MPLSLQVSSKTPCTPSFLRLGHCARTNHSCLITKPAASGARYCCCRSQSVRLRGSAPLIPVVQRVTDRLGRRTTGVRGHRCFRDACATWHFQFRFWLEPVPAIGTSDRGHKRHEQPLDNGATQGRQAGRWWRSRNVNAYFVPPRRTRPGEAQVLLIGKCSAGHQRVSM